MHLLRDVEEHATISISAANTAAAALRLYSIWSSYGVEADEDAFKYGKVVLAASSYDGGLFPPMYDFIHHLQIKAWQKREVALIENGSWAPCAARVMKQMLEEMKDITVKGDVVTLRGADGINPAG